MNTRGWEFNGHVSCTNPLDNETAGSITAAACTWKARVSVRDLFCSGLGDPGSSDTNPLTIDEPAPANTSITCGDPISSLTSTLLASRRLRLQCHYHDGPANRRHHWS
ncbi:MAG: hypothetical protein R2788_21780 [Saprospiraceae bacterium]